ncbi:Transcriptional regulatory protein FixJ [Georgfuchsia toluolica]|uniref:Transcriptional regulatory protein FixJ n=1 Tax=Georgfuchsia toluolica TaxID=424218 RepID=A0A916J208_9PROT|nr:response regulator [Georgfuchsia toluolica]CAG4883132.1 Transcriptional regulatory protein FixJ [Georgfuchsia toluolica]
MTGKKTVFVVDDDPVARDFLGFLLEAENFAVETFDSAETFLAVCRSTPRSCVIVDYRMPGMDGLQLQGELSRRGILLPLIFLTSQGDIPLCKRAMLAGAVNFLTKTTPAEDILGSVREALRESDRMCEQSNLIQMATARLSDLTKRERQVMALAIKALTSKEIARHLNISYRTVEIHRSRIMEKTGAVNLFDLSRIVKASGFNS